jgi:flagellar biosynthesis protein FlhB
MTLGDLLGGAFRIYAAAFLSIIILVALVEVPLTLLSTWIGSVMDQIFLEVTVRMQDAFEPDPLTGVVDPDLVLEILLGPFLEALRQAAPVLILLVLANWIGSMLLTGALICAISQRILGNPINVGNAYSFALGRILFMFGASFLVGLVVVLIALTIIGIPLAIYLAIRWSFALQIAALERRGPLQAIARSSELVSGSWWRVFGIMLLVGILVAIVGGIVGAILGFAPLAGSLIVAVFLAPILAIVQILLYHDLRVRRDTANRYTPETLAAELDRPSPSQVL